jgi:hypothetical protein
MPKRVTLTITVECLDPQTEYQTCDRLTRWFETYGHTGIGHGLVFLYVGLLPRPPSRRKINPKEHKDAKTT